MPKYELGEVIAERQLQLKAAGHESTVSVRIGRPYANGEDWQCPYQIEAQGSKRTMAIYGVDSVQALMLTFVAVNAELEVIARQAKGGLFWLGEPFTSMQNPTDSKRSDGPHT